MLGDDLTAALPELRAHAESMMVDACRVERVTGTRFDRILGVDVADTSLVYAGPCRVKAVDAQSASAGTDSVAWGVHVDEVHLPVAGSEDVRPLDVVTVTGSAMDPGLVGRRLVIRGWPARSLATARRFRVDEVSG